MGIIGAVVGGIFALLAVLLAWWLSSYCTPTTTIPIPTPVPTPINAPMPTTTPTPTLVPTPTDTPTPAPQPTDQPETLPPTPPPIPIQMLLFEEDFENCQDLASKFEVDGYPSWQCVNDEGNGVYETNTLNEPENWSNVNFGSTCWEDYAVEYQVKIPDFQPNTLTDGFQVALAIRRDSTGSDYTHVFSISENYTKLIFSDEEGDWHEPQSATALTPHIFRGEEFIKGKWYLFRIEAQGERIQVFLGGQDDPIIDVEDSRRTQGDLRLAVTPRTHAQFDNIRVYGQPCPDIIDSQP